MHGLDRHTFDNAPPEVTLIAAVIINLKLVYGLDGTCRSLFLLLLRGHSGIDRRVYI
jgi:hypothetical protein